MTNKAEKNEVEKIRKLAEFKTRLEKKIEEATADLEDLKLLLELVNTTLLEKGFRKAEITKPKLLETATLPPVMKYETVIPLKTTAGDLLANLFVSQDSMRVSVAEGKTFNVKTPPFQQFLVERVLNKMQEKDSEAASKGKITPDKIFSYELILDGDVIQEIVIKNLTSSRLRELKSSIRWTLEKMLEKTKGNI
ncbi:MAG: hypothetical protein ACE5KD_01375 [Candidatus Bathyarchaeia archaeon]